MAGACRRCGHNRLAHYKDKGKTVCVGTFNEEKGRMERCTVCPTPEE